MNIQTQRTRAVLWAGTRWWERGPGSPRPCAARQPPWGRLIPPLPPGQMRRGLVRDQPASSPGRLFSLPQFPHLRSAGLGTRLGVREAETMCACQTVSPGPEDVQSLLWSRETVVLDTPSAGGPLLGPEVTDKAMIRWSLDAPSRDHGAPPRALGGPRSRTGHSMLTGVGRRGWSQPLTPQGWAGWTGEPSG